MSSIESGLIVSILAACATSWLPCLEPLCILYCPGRREAVSHRGSQQGDRMSRWLAFVKTRANERMLALRNTSYIFFIYYIWDKN